jgi:hypothetical protein
MRFEHKAVTSFQARDVASNLGGDVDVNRWRLQFIVETTAPVTPLTFGRPCTWSAKKPTSPNDQGHDSLLYLAMARAMLAAAPQRWVEVPCTGPK